MSSTLQYKLPNGMVIIGEPMDQVQSAAFTFMVPCGAGQLPEGCCGAGSVIADLVFRGAADLDSRALIDSIDSLGLHRSTTVNSSHIYLSGALQSDCLYDALRLYSKIICRPTLGPDQFELSRQMALLELQSLDDDPRQKVMMLAAEQFYPAPLGSPVFGKVEDLQAITADKCTEIVREKFYLPDTILSVAGKFDFDQVCKLGDELFSIDQPDANLDIETTKPGNNYTHFKHDGAQVHIGLMTKVPSIQSLDDYYNAMVSVSVLSGGMSSRLFTEVREKRGLCYAVGARYHTLKDFAGIRCYAGTTPEKAQETLDVTLEQFNNLHKGISEDEIQRAVVGLKSSLIMQSESTIARASGIASDYYFLDRVRKLEEIKDNIEKCSVKSVLDFLEGNRFNEYTIVTIGPSQVKVPE